MIARATRERHALRVLDADHDGFVSIGEIHNYARKFDADGDDRLDEQELLKLESSIRLKVPNWKEPDVTDRPE